MIEYDVKTYLDQQLNYNVYLEEPEDEETNFILLEKTGEYDEEGANLRFATIAIQSYAPSMFMASAINDEVKAAMRQIAELTDICQCTLNSSYNYTDARTRRYRYQAVFDLVFQKEETWQTAQPM